MHVRPLHDRILVQRLDEGEQQIGGIIIPDSAKEKPQRGTVIAAGNGKVNDDGERVALDVKAGDTILFGKYSGQEIRFDGVDYLIMKEDEVLARRDAVRHREHSNGKTDYIRRRVAAGHSPRRQRPGECGEGDPRSQGPQRHHRHEIRVAHDHQGRRDRGEGNRAEGPAREHGRADGQGSRQQDIGRRRRRHDHGDRAGAGDLSRGREERHGRRQPHGHQTRHRDSGRGDRRVARGRSPSRSAAR